MRARDAGVDIAKGIGILFVVGFHCGFCITDINQTTFDMPLFYFISGFFIYRYITNDYSAWSFIQKKFKSLLVPYFLYNLMFCTVTYIVLNIGLNIQASSTHLFSVHNLFIEPFISGHQYMLSCPMWFVPSLFLVMCCVCIFQRQLRYFLSNKYRIFFLVAILAGIYYISTLTPYREHKYIAVASRTAIGFVFCVLGCLYYRYKNNVHPSIIFILSVIIYTVIQMECGILSFSFVWNVHPTGMDKFAALPMSLSGILAIISISELICKHGRFACASDLAFLGRNSFHIMALHISAFLLLNIIICVFSTHTVTEITGVYFRFSNIRWLYFFFSVTFCYFTIKYAHALADRFRQRWLPTDGESKIH